MRQNNQTTSKFLALYHFNIHLKQFIHPEDGGSMYLCNVRLWNHITVQKQKRKYRLTKWDFFSEQSR